MSTSNNPGDIAMNTTNVPVAENAKTVTALTELLNNIQGDINPERGYARELDGQIAQAVETGHGLVARLRAAGDRLVGGVQPSEGPLAHLITYRQRNS